MENVVNEKMGTNASIQEELRKEIEAIEKKVTKAIHRVVQLKVEQAKVCNDLKVLQGESEYFKKTDPGSAFVDLIARYCYYNNQSYLYKFTEEQRQIADSAKEFIERKESEKTEFGEFYLIFKTCKEKAMAYDKEHIVPCLAANETGQKTPWGTKKTLLTDEQDHTLYLGFKNEVIDQSPFTKELLEYSNFSYGKFFDYFKEWVNRLSYFIIYEDSDDD